MLLNPLEIKYRMVVRWDDKKMNHPKLMFYHCFCYPWDDSHAGIGLALIFPTKKKGAIRSVS